MAPLTLTSDGRRGLGLGLRPRVPSARDGQRPSASAEPAGGRAGGRPPRQGLRGERGDWLLGRLAPGGLGLLDPLPSPPPRPPPPSPRPRPQISAGAAGLRGASGTDLGMFLMNTAPSRGRSGGAVRGAGAGGRGEPSG